MASTSDIDTVSAVRKFLETSTIVPKELDGEDSSQEVVALLQTASLSFLLFPQMALSLVLQARNALTQITVAEVQLVDFLKKTFADLSNPSEPVTNVSELVNAQTALVEIDRLGRVDPNSQAYANYTAAVQNFMSSQLSSSLKRNSRGEFERTGAEARQDLYSAYASLASLHPVLVQRLKDLLASAADYQSVDLTKLVAGTTVTNLRNSLTQLQADASVLSKTVLAIELLSGQAALQSIAGTRSLYDPLVSTGVRPEGRTITASSEVAAPLATFTGPQTLSGSVTLTVKVDGDLVGESLTIPNCVFLFSAQSSGSIVIPASYALYLNWYTTDASQTTVTKIPITAGTRTRTQVQADVDAVMVSAGIGNCYDVNGYFILVGGATVSKITVPDHGDGTFLAGDYVPSDLSAHLLLGFTDNQATEPKGLLSPSGLVSWLRAYITAAPRTKSGDTVFLASPTTGATGSLVLSGTLLPLYGYANPSTVVSEPRYLTLQEASAPEDLDPASLNITTDCRVTVTGDRGLSGLITAIDGTKLYFSQRLPRGSGLTVRVDSSLAIAVRGLLSDLSRFGSVFDNVLFQLQGVLTPLLSQATLAQINDATRVVDTLSAQLDLMVLVLQNYQVPDREQPNLVQLNSLLSGLEERNLDQAMGLLKRGRFSTFFGLNANTASSGGQFLNAMEQVGQNELATSTREGDQQDPQNVPVSPDDFAYTDQVG